MTKQASTRTECDAEYQHALVEQAVEDSISELSDILRAVVGSLSLYRTKLCPAESAQTAAERRFGVEKATKLRDDLIELVAENIPARLKTIDVCDKIQDRTQMTEQARAAFLSATDINLG